MRPSLATPAVLPAFFWVASALLAGCSSMPHASSTSADKAASGEPTADEKSTQQGPAFDLQVNAPDDVKKYLEHYVELQRYRNIPGLQLTEMARLLGAADENVRELMGTLGYFSPDIKIDVYDSGAAPAESGSAATNHAARPLIAITVAPGPQTKVAAVQLDYSGAVTGEKNFASRKERQLRNWDLQPGEGFTQNGWDGAKSEGLRTLQRRRYPTAKIETSKADIDADIHRANLSVHYDSGPLYKFGDLTIQGAERYDPVGTARIARLPTGNDYSEAAMLDAQTRLAASGYYDAVFLTLDTNTQTPEAAPVIAQTREAKLQKVVFGIGISTDTGPRLSLDHTHNKMPVLGWRAVSKLSWERDKKRISTEWTDLPNENGWRNFGGGEIKREVNGDFTVNSVQIRGGHKKSTDHIDRSAFLQYDFSSSVQGLQKIPSSSALSANYGWTGRYFNDTTNPTRGWGIGAELGAGVTLTPARDPFVRTLLRWQGFVPADRVTAPNGSSRAARFALRAEGGAILAKSAAVLPANLLYITGGDTSVRGYGYRKIGEHLVGDQVYGGRYMAVGSVEYQRPIVRGGEISDFESVVFTDVGAVANKVGDMAPYWGVGTGVRWRSPVGPVQADVAYGLKDKRFRLHLRLGYSF